VRGAALALAAAALAALAAGCGGQSKGGYASIGEASEPGFGPARDGARIEMRDIAFSPKNVHVRRGATVEWINRDRVTHTVTKGDELYHEFTSGELQPRRTYSRSFDRPGVVAYNCIIHANMRGRIKVD
jgi:plastocyanin